MLTPDDPRNPALQPAYQSVHRELLPLGETLKDTVARVIPYYTEEILPRVIAGQEVLIAAHGNSLRALMMHLEALTPEAIMEINLPTGIPLVYTLDHTGAVTHREYLGEAALVAAQMNKVAAQGKAK